MFKKFDCVFTKFVSPDVRQLRSECRFSQDEFGPDTGDLATLTSIRSSTTFARLKWVHCCESPEVFGVDATFRGPHNDTRLTTELHGVTMDRDAGSRH